MNYMLDPNATPLKAFPNDKKIRVVIAFGALYKNANKESDSHDVEVLLSEVSILKRKNINKYIVIHVPVIKISKVKIGSLWQGRNKLDSDWEYFNQDELTLDIDLSVHEPIIANNVFEKYFSKISSHNLSKQICKEALSHFNNSIYISFNDKKRKVLIPSYEIYSSTYSPDTESLTKDILNFPFDMLLDKYCDIGCKFLEPDIYQMKFKKRIKRSGMYLLSYLMFNEKSMTRVSKFWNSLSSIDHDSNGFIYYHRYPIILPYNPGRFKVTVTGISIGNEFLVQRIKTYYLPENFKMSFIKDEKKYISNNSYTNDCEVNSRFGTKLSSDVLIDNRIIPYSSGYTKKDQIDVTIVFNEENEKVIKSKDIQNKNYFDSEIEVDYTLQDALSCAEATSSSSARRVGKTGTKIASELNSHKFIFILNILREMKSLKIEIKDKVFLKDFVILDEKFNAIAIDNEPFPSFKNFIDINKNNKKKLTRVNELWFEIKIVENKRIQFLRWRMFLLIKLLFSNGKEVYLFEIDSKANQGYLGVVFSYPFDDKVLKEFIKETFFNRGVFKKDSCSKFHRYETFKHVSNLEERIKNAIKSFL